MKILATKYDLMMSPKFDENQEKSMDRGVDISNTCTCCGKEIKNIETAKQIHLIEGGVYFTEDEREFGDGDMGWFFIGNSCYKKFLKNRKEIEITQ